MTKRNWMLGTLEKVLNNYMWGNVILEIDLALKENWMTRIIMVKIVVNYKYPKILEIKSVLKENHPSPKP